MLEALNQTQPETQFYQWRGYRCAYETRIAPIQLPSNDQLPLLLLHPIGVGLSRHFWDRFCQAWFQSEQTRSIYSPDLLGCGDSDMPHAAYTSEDWAEQLQFFIQTVVKQPVVLVAQGALLPVAIALIQLQQPQLQQPQLQQPQLQQPQLQTQPNLVQSLVLSGPPAWAVMTKAAPVWQQKLLWNLLFDSVAGRAFYEYARRRQFIQSFSVRQLFADAADVDAEWLNTLVTDAKTPASRYAVFSFLAGFWRKNWETAIARLNIPTLVVVGNQASSISKSGKGEDPGDRLQDYLRRLPQGQGMQIAGRNVLPYESTELFVEAIVPFINQDQPG